MFESFRWLSMTPIQDNRSSCLNKKLRRSSFQDKSVIDDLGSRDTHEAVTVAPV
jgi:hypothetical protein